MRTEMPSLQWIRICELKCSACSGSEYEPACSGTNIRKTGYAGITVFEAACTLLIRMHAAYSSVSSVISIGLRKAAAPASRMVRMMTLNPEEISAVRGRTLKIQLTAMETASRPPIK